MRQLTFGGQSGEAYFSADDKYLIFQHQGQFIEGQGRTTCSYFFPSGDRILYSSTFAAGAACPPPDYSQGYVWPIYNTYTIYTARSNGSDLRSLSSAPGYNAESTITRDGKHIVFTSTRSGDLDIYTMDADGMNVKQLTHELGYDGGRSGPTTARRSSTALNIRRRPRRSRTTRICTRAA